MLARAIPIASIAVVLVQQPSTPVAVRPLFNYVGSTACGDVSAYAWTKELTEQLTARVDLKALGIKVGESRRFDLATVDVAFVDVHVTLFD